MSDYNVLAVGSKSGFYKGAEMMFILNNPENAKLILQIMEMDSKGVVYSDKDSLLESGIQKVVDKIHEYESVAADFVEDSNGPDEASRVFENKAKVMREVVGMIDPRFLSEEIVMGSKAEEKPILVALGENTWGAVQVAEDLRGYGIKANVSKDNDTVIEVRDIKEDQLMSFLDTMRVNYTIWDIPDRVEEEELSK